MKNLQNEKKLIIGNLKMNLLSETELQRYFSNFKKEIKEKDLSGCELVLCPPAVYIDKFAKNLGNKTVKIGAQNIFWEKQGAYTGEISAPMVKNLGGEYVIAGHSERRRYFGETDETANLKIQSALKYGLRPIYCVGESKVQREMGQTKDVITRQIVEGLKNISSSRIKELVIAYEPIWSVGTDVVPSSNELMEIKILIKKILSFDLKYKIMPPIIYGGSVKPAMVKKLCLEPGMDGVLVGRESLAVYDFIKIATIINNYSDANNANKC